MIDHASFAGTFGVAGAAAADPGGSLGAGRSGSYRALVRWRRIRASGGVAEPFPQPAFEAGLRRQRTAGSGVGPAFVFHPHLRSDQSDCLLRASVSSWRRSPRRRLVVRLFMGWIARRFSEFEVLATALFIAATAYALFPFVKEVGPLMALSFALGLALGCAQPMVMSLLHSIAPAGRMGKQSVCACRSSMPRHLPCPCCLAPSARP